MFLSSDFQPAWLLRNRHAQTLLGVFMRSTDHVTFHRQRIDTPDGDFIDLDFVDTADLIFDQQKQSPIVLLLPGMGGSPRSSYACELYRQLAKVGIRSIGMNYRSCSGEANRALRTYHAGATDDVAHVLSWLRQQYPDVPLGAVGVSFGGNLLLKYLGEGGNIPAAAVAISPPFNLAHSAQILENGSGKLYDRKIAATLRQTFQAKVEQVRHLIDTDLLMNSRSIREFDKYCTAPLHGFPDVETYYAQVSSGRFLQTITTPTLIIISQDDPFHDPHDIPHSIIDNNSCLTKLVTKHGGHVGFANGSLWNLSWWAHEQSTAFLKTLLSYPR